MMHDVTLHHTSELSSLHGVHEGARLTFFKGMLPFNIRSLMGTLRPHIMNANPAQPAASPLLQHYSTNNTADAEMSLPTTASGLE
jgi:hypothetical protein